MASRAGVTGEQFARQQEARRHANAMEALGEALEEASALEVPPVVREIAQRKTGVAPLLSVDALELARQVYYLQHGSLADAARAIVAAGLADTDVYVRVYGRLQNWWAREGWPRRATNRTFAIRDANHDGGMFRSTRTCRGRTTGTGPAPAGKQCEQSALPDSDYCYHHDPRPEYADRRHEEGVRLAAARMVDAVPLEPFQRFCDRRRIQLVESARARGERVNANDVGWGRLARSMGVDQSMINRLMQGKTLKDSTRVIDTIRASTVARYIEPLGLTFRDIYGYDQPSNRAAAYNVCPNCGGYKAHESKTCRSCFEAGEYVARCTYVSAAGHRCPTKTKHPSGHCSACRKMLAAREERARNPQPKKYRKSALNGRLLAYALDEHLRMPRAEWVAARLWAANIEGVRDHFKHRRSLASAIVKQFRAKDLTNISKRKSGFAAEDAMRAMLDELVREHGPIEWPSAPAPQGMREIPFEPFRAWLAQRRTEVRTLKQLAARTGLSETNLSQMIEMRGAHGEGKRTVWKATVTAALARYGDGTTYDDLYRS